MDREFFTLFGRINSPCLTQIRAHSDGVTVLYIREGLFNLRWGNRYEEGRGWDVLGFCYYGEKG